MKRGRYRLISKQSINQANLRGLGNMTAICSAACGGVRGGGPGMEVWMFQTDFIRCLTTDGESPPPGHPSVAHIGRRFGVQEGG